jgi:hypothetical protein
LQLARLSRRDDGSRAEGFMPPKQPAFKFQTDGLEY